jgi:hypothetical protein
VAINEEIRAAFAAECREKSALIFQTRGQSGFQEIASAGAETGEEQLQRIHRQGPT